MLMTMPDRSRKRPTDPNELARQVVDEATGEAPPFDPDAGKDPAAVALGRKGGLKGGKARAERLPDVIGAIEPAEDDRPRGQEAVRRLMRESVREWRPADLIAEIQRRGWIDPAAKTPGAAVRVALRRLVDAGEVVKVEQG